MELPDDQVDAHVDAEIDACLDLDKPKSFFLFAGAGSGKTHSLVEALRRLCERSGRRLRLQRRRVAVITYTNAACDEIKERLEFNPLVQVSTIHSFAWDLIQPLQQDIRDWLRQNLKIEIDALREAQARGKVSKASQERARKIESKTRRLSRLEEIKTFTYSPTGDNRSRDALNHTEVMKISADFLRAKPLMQSILVNQFPVLLIDECQDTIRGLMEALLHVQQCQSGRFTLGLLGDTMQRIFGEGKPDLGDPAPAGWATPAKKMNHRSPQRIVTLINRIRSVVDQQSQLARRDKPGGVVRFFILPSTIEDKRELEGRIRVRMAEVTQDAQWKNTEEVKTLMLEHHMTAASMGFSELFMPLYEADEGSYRTALLEGDLSGMKFFTDIVLPLRAAYAKGNDFQVAAIVRKLSPLLSELKASKGEDQTKHVRAAKKAVEDLMMLWCKGEPTLLDIARSIRDTRLFELPEILHLAILPDVDKSSVAPLSGAEEDERDPMVEAWESALRAPLSQVAAYAQYVRGEAPYGTHQGIKGLEFQRVLVIMDDAGSRGFSFSYEKLFGAVLKSKSDVDHERKREETIVDRTRRLFYVTCSRAEESLALVAYSGNPGQVRKHVIEQGWFGADEIDTLGQ